MTTLNSPDVAPSVVTDMTAKNSDSKGEAGQRLLHDEAVSALTTKNETTTPKTRPTDKGFEFPDELTSKAHEHYDRHNNLSVQDRADMEKGIKAADNLDKPWIRNELEEIKDKLDKEMTPEDKVKIAQTEKEFFTATQGLGETKVNDYRSLWDQLKSAKTPEDAAATAKQMAELYPAVDAKRTAMESAKKPFEADINKQFDLQSLADASARIRFNYACMLRNPGDDTPPTAEDCALAGKLVKESLSCGASEPERRRILAEMAESKDDK